MKITYPECQIEISTDEVIDLLDYFEDRQPKVECREDFNHLNIKRPELHMPEISEEAKKEIEETIQKYMRGCGSQLLKETDPNPEFEPGGIVPENTEDAIEGNLAQIQFNMGGVVPEKFQCSEPKPKNKISSKKVDVLTEDGWVSFDSQGKAAKFLGVAPSWLSKSLEQGKTCNGHHVRYTPNPELDACLAEIKENDKQPYQPSKPVR